VARRRRVKKHADFLDLHRGRYDEILAKQGGHCALCPTKPSARRKLDLDHCHRRMAVRGLLCPRCNRALPAWVTPEWLKKAAVYIDGEA